MHTKNLRDILARLPSYDPEALSVTQATDVIRQFITPLAAPETVALRDALGRVLAVEVISPIDVPAHDNSAMDGYALRGSDLTADAAVSLKVIGSALAGRPFLGTVARNECVRIMTGSVMPAACDTVIPQEMTDQTRDTSITVPPGVLSPGDNRRLRGEDLKAGTPALLKGKILRPAELGLLASLGIAELPVQRRLRVAFFSTGDELRSLGETLDEGCVYDSNRYTVLGMLTRLGCEVIDMGVVRDDPAPLEAALRNACEVADAIITSGGMSTGEADHSRQMIAKLGEVAFWNIAMRPGRPMAFGRIASNGKSAYLFGLPGNPVAVMVSFYFFVREALLRMRGAEVGPLPLIRVKSTNAIRKKVGRTEFQRGILSVGADGLQEVRVTGSQGSGILRSMAEANCMVVLREDQASVNEADLVDVVLFEGLV
ncbi:molybdopterin molybdotransferase MoeA [soil metagenome]